MCEKKELTGTMFQMKSKNELLLQLPSWFCNYLLETREESDR